MSVNKRLDALSALDERVEERVEERLEEEFDRLYDLLERHLSDEEYAKVLAIAARGD